MCNLQAVRKRHSTTAEALMVAEEMACLADCPDALQQQVPKGADPVNAKIVHMRTNMHALLSM